ncbi:BOS complex subunit NOMO2 [Lepeophtheirus salmonis]|uniref:BOS complex subunit NOMO2 n=1 Tax=Lepeophtheirus salmonis TaxID=72036 RepID=UPI001AEA1EE1|nr:nodal modulator 2-like [Lepeophtheirus salmonis]
MVLPVSVFVVFLGLCTQNVVSESVLGCGGFIKGGPLDLSRVEVELRSKEGNILKYKTDPAPNNGYYFLPVYEKGEYVLKIKLPPSWETEPSEISVSIDGVNDPCTKNKDLDFIFKGFAISGSIRSKGSDFGPLGVSLELSDSKRKSLSNVTSGENGIFSFKGVVPGEYTVKASDDRYSFESDTIKVSVQEEAKFLNDIIISGYDIKGRVVMEDNEPLEGFELKMGDLQSQTDAKGDFLFKNVPFGSYQIEPLISTSIKITPSKLKADILSHGHLTLETPFIVRGFDVKGKIAGVKSPESLSLKLLKANEDDVILKTSDRGEFVLNSVKKGTYSLRPVLDGYDFEDIVLQISGPSYELPVVQPTRFRVSGRVERDRLGFNLAGDLKVNFANTEGKVMGKVLVSDEGSFSIYLPPGQVKASVEVALEDRRKGIGGFAPVNHAINVKDEPISNVEFTPIKVSVAGTVQSISKNLKTRILLTSTDMEDFVFSTDVKNGKFMIDNVLPGTYTASIAKEEGDIRCWETPSHKLSISEDFNDIKFIQKGFNVEIVTTNNLKVYLGKKKNIELKKGSNTVCVEIENQNLEISTEESCHRFDVTPKSIQSDTKRVTIEAKSHKISGYIRSKALISDLEIQLSSRAKNSASKIPFENKGSNSHFEFFAESKEEFTVTPKAKEHLFEPERLHLSVENDCMLDSVIFEAREGVFVRGKISPPLEGVKVSLSDELYGFSDKSGVYQIGPLADDIKKGQSIIAYKDGYAFTSGDKHGDFNAKKLASIEVFVSDGDVPLSSVLVSISGRENYRNRSVTKEGRVSFLMLEPGEYFVKPILSEYEFEPKNHLFKIEEGDTQRMHIKALRVAFSCYGKISSLNGDPESGIVVVASGESNNCDNSEAISNSQGDFRIRGLIPGCRYKVGLMQSYEQDSKIETFIPKSASISVEAKDIPQVLRFTVVLKFPWTEFSLIVKDDQKFSPIRVKFSSVEKDDISIVKKEFSDHIILFPSVPLDPDTSYYLSAESLNEKFNVNQKAASIKVQANTTFQAVTLTLEKVESKPKAFKSNHFWLLSLLPLGGIAVFHRQLFESFYFSRMRN